MTTGKRLLNLWLFAIAACVATPLPQPPSFELDVDKIDAESTETAIGFVGAPGALTPGPIGLRVTPAPTDSDPPLELGSADVAADGSFTVLVVSPADNTFFFEAITEEEDIFVGAVTIDADGLVIDADPGLDSDDDGSPDEIDCAPDDETLSGSRCD